MENKTVYPVILGISITCIILICCFECITGAKIKSTPKVELTSQTGEPSDSTRVKVQTDEKNTKQAEKLVTWMKIYK